MPTESTRNQQQSADRVLFLPESDYRDVATEILEYIRNRASVYVEESRVFLEKRAEAAPTMVNHAEMLNGLVAFYVSRWIALYEE